VSALRWRGQAHPLGRRVPTGGRPRSRSGATCRRGAPGARGPSWLGLATSSTRKSSSISRWTHVAGRRTPSGRCRKTTISFAFAIAPRSQRPLSSRSSFARCLLHIHVGRRRASTSKSVLVERGRAGGRDHPLEPARATSRAPAPDTRRGAAGLEARGKALEPEGPAAKRTTVELEVARAGAPAPRLSRMAASSRWSTMYWPHVLLRAREIPSKRWADLVREGDCRV